LCTVLPTAATELKLSAVNKCHISLVFNPKDDDGVSSETALKFLLDCTLSISVFQITQELGNLKFMDFYWLLGGQVG
jgi:hypothetical protein